MAIFGDYDVDGAASAALLSEYLQACGCETLIHIPDRVIEGYGPNVEAMTALNKLVPAAHILFGTDFPFGAAVRDVPSLQTAGFSPSDLRGVFAANAMALFAQRPS